jgi:putative membrane protein
MQYKRRGVYSAEMEARVSSSCSGTYSGMMQNRQHRRKREWLRFVIRVLVIWVIEVLGLLFMAWLLRGVQVEGLLAAVGAVAAIGVLNALLWPLLSYLILPFAVLTLGFLSLILNAGLVLLAGELVTGFQVEGLWPAVWLTLGLTAINTILSSLLTLDDDNSWYRNVVQRRMRRRGRRIAGGQPADSAVPGILFLELDGLALPVLARAIRGGYMPTLAHWLESGSHRLVGWETDLSSQTSASQAGILHGDNQNIPAFRWWDRTRKQIVSSSSPQEVARLEREHSDGNGLLFEGGASRGNLFSGDAPDVMLTASVATDLTRFHAADFYAYFVNPYNFGRTLLLTVWEMILEIWQFRQARRKGVYPILDRKKRGGKYPMLRAFTTVVMRELNVHTLVGDMFAGVPSAYATFVGYDEVAHHSGVESQDAFDVLRKLDRQLARLESAARQAPRPYHLALLSDHGQSGGATFKQRYGLTLEKFVQQLATDRFGVQGDVDVHEDWKHVNVFLTETIQHERKAVSGPLRRLLRGCTRDGRVDVGPGGQEMPDLASHIVVLASGNLGLVYSSRLDERATLEQMEVVYPGLLDGLAEHEGIGFILVHSEAHGPVAIGAGGRHYLLAGRLEGEDPLAAFGPNAAAHLRRTDAFPDAPDILVSSLYDPETGEVAAFEELIGSHGGLGGWQTQPFLMYPSALPRPEAPIVGAANLHEVLKGWLRTGLAAEEPKR